MANKKRTTGKARRQHAFEQDANLVREAIRRTVQEVLEEEMTQLLGVAKSERTGSRRGYRSAPATTSSPGDPRGAHRAAHTPLLPRLPASYPVSPRVHGNGVDPNSRGADLGAGDLQVAGGDGEAAVAEQKLDGADVYDGLEQMDCEGMTIIPSSELN